MNIQTQLNPDGKWQAVDENDDPGPEHASDTPNQPIGYGDTEQEAIDELCKAYELPYSYEADEELLREQEWWAQLNDDEQAIAGTNDL